MKKQKKRLFNYKNIEYITAGVYSHNDYLNFSISGGTDGMISSNGQISIPVCTLDKTLIDSPTFIKMDIEGSEKEALKGARNCIQKNKPKLAIAAYHFASDLWELANQIRDLNSDYKIYLRHYSETGLETVIYAV